MARIKSGWLRLIRDYHELLVWARKLETRDSHGSVILRLWAEAKAWALSGEVAAGTVKDAARALRTSRAQAVQKLSRKKSPSAGAQGAKFSGNVCEGREGYSEGPPGHFSTDSENGGG